MKNNNKYEAIDDLSRLGFGCWPLGGHGWGKTDKHESIMAVKNALDLGIKYFDTADCYGFGLSEELLSNCLKEKRKQVTISTKFGIRWNDSGQIWKDISPEYLNVALEASLRRLKLDFIPIYFVHWPDGKTPIYDVMEKMLRMKEEGKIGAIGISNFSIEQIELALQVCSIQFIQTKFNLIEKNILYNIMDLCKRENIKIICWGALSDGLLAGKFNMNTSFSDDDHRSRNSQFMGNKFLDNLDRVEKLKDIANRYSVLPAQLALRWVLDTDGVNLVIFGAKTQRQVNNNLGCIDFSLSREDYIEIDSLW